MYCGDETGAFIGDVGSHTSRFGYGGEDNPKYVVPSYSLAGGDDKTNVVPSSPLVFRGNVTPVYRMADCNTEAMNEPQVDPNAYLQQGDMIHDWDAFEAVWQSSFDVMHVRDKFKHTSGGRNASINTEGTYAAAAVAAGGTTSETVRSIHKGSGSCPHPLLAVDSGCTAIVGDTCSNNDDANNNNNHDTAASHHHQRQLHNQQRMKMTEVFMESLDASALFVAPSPMLAAFSHGRQTCMVVDVGAGGCRATPVIDGLLLSNAQRRNGRGGDWLGNVQWKAMMMLTNESSLPLKPRYLLRRNHGNASTVGGGKDSLVGGVFSRWAMQELMYEFRSSDHVGMPKWRMDVSTPFVYDSGDVNAGAAAASATAMQVEQESEPATYELPDGTVVDLTTRVGKDLCRLPELLFSDDVPFVGQQQEGERYFTKYSSSPTLCNLPLHKLVHQSLTAVGDADARKELCGNIVLTGASSLFPNMEQRLSYELSTIVPSTYKCRVLASRTSVERSCASWIGGSIITSLGSFQQLWLSKKEYDEYGASLVIQRFPS